jgi:hypothetical protein
MGYPELALLLRRAGVSEGEANAQDAAELFRRMVFNILVDNTDDHEKNHSLLVVAPWDNGRFRLAPAYDVLPCNSGQGRAWMGRSCCSSDAGSTRAATQRLPRGGRGAARSAGSWRRCPHPALPKNPYKAIGGVDGCAHKNQMAPRASSTTKPPSRAAATFAERYSTYARRGSAR